jgi:hypothetical protein
MVLPYDPCVVNLTKAIIGEIERGVKEKMLSLFADKPKAG